MSSTLDWENWQLGRSQTLGAWPYVDDLQLAAVEMLADWWGSAEPERKLSPSIPYTLSATQIDWQLAPNNFYQGLAPTRLAPHQKKQEGIHF